MTYDLYIGDRTYSSWSLRGWLMFEKFNIPCRTHMAGLHSGTLQQDLADLTPARLVPAIRTPDGDAVGDTMAIAETLAERHPDAGLWPADQMARAKARAVSAEMASGFVGLRSQFPMNCRRDIPGVTPNTDAARDIARIETIWRECRDKFGKSGPYLFGEFSIADAMYAPVASRFNTYGLASSDTSRAYVHTLLSMAEMKQWYADGKAETWVIKTAEL